MRALMAVALIGALVGCGARDRERARERADRGERSRSMQSSGGEAVDDGGRCQGESPDREVSEYDTSGDEIPDVRKVFLRVGEAPAIRLVLICREADLNADGTKDVVRYYNDEGRPLREEADRNFDGQMDEISYFEDGRVVRQETDTNYDGRVDTKIFYEGRQPIRAERDMTGRSTPTDWRPDRWEYFENGRMVRMGTDLDGDGRVDRWDRDEAYRRQLEREQIERERQEAVDDGYIEDEEVDADLGDSTDE